VRRGNDQEIAKKALHLIQDLEMLLTLEVVPLPKCPAPLEDEAERRFWPKALLTQERIEHGKSLLKTKVFPAHFDSLEKRKEEARRREEDEQQSEYMMAINACTVQKLSCFLLHKGNKPKGNKPDLVNAVKRLYPEAEDLLRANKELQLDTKDPATVLADLQGEAAAAKPVGRYRPPNDEPKKKRKRRSDEDSSDESEDEEEGDEEVDDEEDDEEESKEHMQVDDEDDDDDGGTRSSRRRKKPRKSKEAANTSNMISDFRSQKMEKKRAQRIINAQLAAIADGKKLCTSCAGRGGVKNCLHEG